MYKNINSIISKLAYVIVIFHIFILAACTTTNDQAVVSSSDVPVAGTTTQKNTQADQKNIEVSTNSGGKTQSEPMRPAPEIFPGTGRFTAVPSGKEPVISEAGDITLMFQDAPIEEVASTILGDLLGRAYVVDERVKGMVSLKTGRPLRKDTLIPVMENILKANNAVLAENEGVFQILPASESLSSVVSPSYNLDRQKGYQIIVVPLSYISAPEMKKILQSLQGEKANIQLDAKRNILLLSGTQAELKNMLDTVEIFDVDQFKGMSTALFRLSSSSAKTVISELRSIFSFDGEEDQGGIVRFVEIERLNAILVITPQRRYLNTVSQWVDRLDRVDNIIARTLHVYFVQNLRAEYLAGILSELFDADVSTQEAEDPTTLAPGLSGSTIQSSAINTGIGNTNAGLISGSADTLNPNVPSTPGASLPGSLSPNIERFASTERFGERPETGGDGSSPIKIIADEQNNALVVKATKEEYKDIEEAIKRLDITPLQVLVEATIVEVALIGDLRYGVEWFFEHTVGAYQGIATLDTGAPGLAALSPGFSYSIVDSSDAVRGVLNALASDSKIRVLSSPSLMVLDNHVASINIGDQVPVRTSESTNTGTTGADAIVTSTIQFVETGVSLQVGPRVGKGGSVVMDIYQNIRTASATDTSNIDSPTINQREVVTSVAVQSGDTIVLGGLIQDDESDTNEGIPGLRHLPILGPLFGTTTRASTRTELLVLITPTAVRNQTEAREATTELRKKLKGLNIPELKDSDATIRAIEHKGIRW